jgi:hypothetical protein
MTEQAYVVKVSVPDFDADLLDKIPDAIKSRFEMTAVTVTWVHRLEVVHSARLEAMKDLIRQFEIDENRVAPGVPYHYERLRRLLAGLKEQIG